MPIQPIGFIKLHRELASEPIWTKSNPEQKVVLVTLLMMANFKKKNWLWDGFQFEAQPGQFVTSLESIAKNCGTGVNIQSVRSSLKKFEKLGFLTNESTKTGRLITIANWSLYSGEFLEPTKQPTKSQQRANKDPTNNPTPREEGKEGEEGKNKNIYDELFAHYISAGLIQHKHIDESMKKGIDTAIKTLGCDVEEMKRMIDRHKQKSDSMKDYPNFKIRKLGEFFGQKKWQSVELICSDYTDDLYDKSKSPPKKQSTPSIDDKPWMMDFKEWQKANGVVEDES